MKSLKLGSKLVTGFILVALIGGISGWIGLINMGRINTMLDNLYSNKLVPITKLAGANLHAIYHDRTINDLIIGANRVERESIAA